MAFRTETCVPSTSHQETFSVMLQQQPGASTRPSVNVNTRCLLCLVNITPATSTSSSIAQHHNDAFTKLCKVLKVNLSPFSWNFVLEPFPFCPKCATKIFSLYEFYEKVKEIEKSINSIISQIKSQIKSSESTKTSMPSDVRAVIFRGQVLEDLETTELKIPQDSGYRGQVTISQPDSGSQTSCGSLKENQNSVMAILRKSTTGLVYNPSNNPSNDAPISKSASQTETTTPETSTPNVDPVSALEAHNETSARKQSQTFSTLVSESINVIAGSSNEEADVDLKQLLGAVEVYPTLSDCSPNKTARVVNLNYVAANETVTTEENVPRSSDRICVEVAPTRIQYGDDFEPYHDDCQDDSQYNDSDDDEENQEIKEAVSHIEEEFSDGNDYSPRAKKRKRSSPASTKVCKTKPSSYEDRRPIKTEPKDCGSETQAVKKKTKSSTRERSTKPKSEKKQYASLIHADTNGRMFYEGIQIKTCNDNPKAVSCGECGKVFSNHAMLSGNKKSVILHMRTHHLEKWHDGEKLVTRKRAPPVSYVGMLETDEQGKVFFKGHEIVGTKDTIGYSCGTCGKAYTGRTPACEKRGLVIRHIQAEHLGDKFDCDQCDASYKSKGSLYDHKLKKHVHGEVECDICGKKMFKKYIKYHRFSHMNPEERKAAIVSGTAPAAALRKMGSCVCNFCGIVLKGADSLKRHERTHTADMVNCEICGKQIKSSSMSSHIRSVHKGRKQRYTRCPKCYKNTTNLEVHMKAHSVMPSNTEDALSFECSICGLRSASEEKNRIHEAKKHQHGPTRFKENYTFACNFCSKRYLTKKSRRDHQNRIHPTEVASFKSKQLTQPLSIKVDSVHTVDYSKMGRHLDLDISEAATAKVETSETGEMTFLTVKITKVADGYKCGMCGAEVKEEGVNDKTGSIRNHIRAYHLGEFQCDQCGKFWKRQSALNKHKRDAHLVVSCPVCQRQTSQKCLQLHLWTHKSQEEKQAVIDAGDFSKIPFVVKQELGIPILKSQNDCNVCGITLPNKKLLEKHQRSAHPETKKFWNRRRHNLSRRVNTEELTSEEEFFSFSETDSSDMDEISLRKTDCVRSRRSNRNPNHHSKHRQTSPDAHNLNPYVLVSRLPAVISKAKKFVMINDDVLDCTFSDGEAQEISIGENSEKLPTYFEIAIDTNSTDGNYSSGSDEDFAVIPDSSDWDNASCKSTP